MFSNNTSTATPTIGCQCRNGGMSEWRHAPKTCTSKPKIWAGAEQKKVEILVKKEQNARTLLAPKIDFFIAPKCCSYVSGQCPSSD